MLALPPEASCRLGGVTPTAASRRRFLGASAGAALGTWLAPPPTGEKLLGTLPFLGEGGFPLGTIVGAGLGQRRAFDLSTLSRGTLVSAADQFFIRTGCPDRLPPTPSWTLDVRGLVERPLALKADELRREATGQGTHLLECSGNSRAAHFGLMSAAQWTGVPLERVLERVGPRRPATQVLVSGFDEHSVSDPDSVPGASWIFDLDRIRGAGAFLATEMNGAPLRPDHGHPLRLVVPGWYGCTAIKWVNEIVLVDDAAPATDQMHEYAGRTHQDPVGPRDTVLMRAGRRPEGPPRAKDFQPATIDPAALAVRVEKLGGAGGAVSYRVVGVLWGAPAPARGLVIRFNPDLGFAPVDEIGPVDGRTWTLWWHRFRPPAPGRYRIELAIGGAGVRTRRLDAGFYAREIEIT
jgi:DMSO/TMAO reductase YedYZ molybdopterin-dependent catalytic subunit